MKQKIGINMNSLKNYILIKVMRKPGEKNYKEINQMKITIKD